MIFSFNFLYQICVGSRETIKGLTIGLILSILTIMTGCMMTITYALLIFKSAETEVAPQFSAITIAVAQVLGNLCTTQLADKLGRKMLLLASMLGPAFGLFSLCVYFYFKNLGYDLHSVIWLPVISLSFVMFIGSAGIIPLAGCCTVENLPPKVY